MLLALPSPARPPSSSRLRLAPADATSRSEAFPPFVEIVRSHHQAVFRLAHALLRDEDLAEAITRQVFSRARVRCAQAGDFEADPVEWVYHAALRFIRMYHWRSLGLLSRRRVFAFASRSGGCSVRAIVCLLARHPGALETRDCDLLAMRHVLGMPLANIAQLLRMHPYEVSNRLAWAQDRLACIGRESPTVGSAASHVFSAA